MPETDYLKVPAESFNWNKRRNKEENRKCNSNSIRY